MTQHTLQNDAPYVESGGWTRFQRREPQLDRSPARELLALTWQRLGGNLRYAIAPQGTLLCGEVPGVDQPSRAAGRLEAWLENLEGPAASSPEADEIETALAESGFAWLRREQSWAVPTSGGSTMDLAIAAAAGGASVRALLAETPADDVCGEALGEYLCRAQLGLRFARAEWRDERVCVASFVESEHLMRDLPIAVSAVATACDLLAESVRALGESQELAQAYLEMIGGIRRNQSI
jgi:hypothetical protein